MTCPLVNPGNALWYLPSEGRDGQRWWHVLWWIQGMPCGIFLVKVTMVFLVKVAMVNADDISGESRKCLVVSAYICSAEWTFWCHSLYQCLHFTSSVSFTSHLLPEPAFLSVNLSWRLNTLSIFWLEREALLTVSWVAYPWRPRQFSLNRRLLCSTTLSSSTFESIRLSTFTNLLCVWFWSRRCKCRAASVWLW